MATTVHIVGLGALGKFLAYNLAALAERPALCLITRRDLGPEMTEQGISIRRNNHIMTQHGFDVRPARALAAKRESIRHLIVGTKCAQVAPALQELKPCLSPASTVLFLQNGMGWLEEVNERVFPDPAQRPGYMHAIVSHGLAADSAFQATHHGPGEIWISPILNPVTASNETSKDNTTLQAGAVLTRLLTAAPDLQAVSLTGEEHAARQFLKMAANSMFNPVTALLDMRNGDLLANDAFLRLMQTLADEIGTVLQPLAQQMGFPTVVERMAGPTIYNFVIDMARKTALNKNSMLQDVANHRRTEIDYLLGYVARKAIELGLPCPRSQVLTDLIKSKEALVAPATADGAS